MSLANVDRSAWRALFAAQSGRMLDAMDFLLFTYALIPIQKTFGLSGSTIALVATSALVAGAVGGILFGRLADRIGRVRAMTFSILLYSLATAGLATPLAWPAPCSGTLRPAATIARQSPFTGTPATPPAAPGITPPKSPR